MSFPQTRTTPNSLCRVVHDLPVVEWGTYPTTQNLPGNYQKPWPPKLVHSLLNHVSCLKSLPAYSTQFHLLKFTSEASPKGPCANPQPRVLLGNGRTFMKWGWRKLGHWGWALERTTGAPAPSFLFLIPSQHEVSVFDPPHAPHRDVLLVTGLKATKPINHVLKALKL